MDTRRVTVGEVLASRRCRGILILIGPGQHTHAQGNKNITPDDYEERVAYIDELWSGGTMTWAEVADAVYEAGFRTSTGGRITHNTVEACWRKAQAR